MSKVKSKIKSPSLSTKVYMVYDSSRESAVVPFLDDAFPDVKTVAKQIQVGDYMICSPTGGEPTILADIERKTWNDFAAGFYDGRYENVKKMKALRAKTGCQLIYIIEGNPFPSPDRKFQRIPARNIIAAINKLMIRDGAYIVYTEDQAHTAKKLYELCKTFETCILGNDELDGGGDRETFGGAHSADEIKENDDAAKPASAATTAAATTAAATTAADVQYFVPELATERIEDSDELSTIKMWARLHGISIVQGSVLIRQFSIADLATGLVTIDQIRALKTTSGRAIAKDAVDSLLNVRLGDDTACTKIISGAKGITPAIAGQVLKSCNGLSRLCSYSDKTMAIIAVDQNKRTTKFGPARSARLHRLLHYKHEAAIAVVAPPPARIPLSRIAREQALAEEGIIKVDMPPIAADQRLSDDVVNDLLSDLI